MKKKKIDIGIICDCSRSLEDYRDALICALRKTVLALKTNEDLFGYEVYFTLIPFASEIQQQNVIDCKLINEINTDDINLHIGGTTNPGPALKQMINKFMDRYTKWKEDGTLCAHPLIFFFSDGKPYPVAPCQKEYEAAAKTIREKEDNKKVLIVGCSFGNANYENMKIVTNYPERILKINDGSNIEKLTRFFSEIISSTTICTITGAIDAMNRMFKKFNSEE